MSRFLLGVDTGGTYTDAVLINAEARAVVASAKALTTKGDIAVGVSEALGAVLASCFPGDVDLVCVSTTLATNAVVEGQGAPVGVVLIGFDDAMLDRTGVAAAFPEVPILSLAGGHDHNGDERAPLDLGALAAWATLVVAEANVEAFCVTSQFAVRNPAHERAARDVLVAGTGRPVTISTELSTALDSPRRALTTLLNARLISRITSLVLAIERSMRDLGLTCPMMVVKGDGTLAIASSMVRRPIETVLSGPAASLVGAAWLSGVRDAIVSDIGGTTTDIGVLTDAMPRVRDDGAIVAGWRTMVRAIDVSTTGLGGDSEVALDDRGAVTIGPNRVVPLSLLAHRYPAVLDSLRAEAANADGPWLTPAFLLLPFGRAAGGATTGLSAAEYEVVDRVCGGPMRRRDLATSSRLQRAASSLVRRGVIHLSALTPSDAAHVLGLQANWSTEAARLAAFLQTRSLGAVESFCRSIWDATVTSSSRAVLAAALGEPVERGSLLADVCAGRTGHGMATVAVHLDVPVVAVGGPAHVYYPEVGRRLGASVIVPDRADVANAVGAAVACIARRLTVGVQSTPSGFQIHLPSGVQVAPSGHVALALAEAEARQWLHERVVEAGGHEPTITVTIEAQRLPGATGDDGLIFATVEAVATSVPISRYPRP